MAINATKTIAVYDLDGSTEFLIPFEYLARKFVVVTLLGVDRQTLIINTDYRFVSPTLISLNVAQPVGYTQIELRRFTSATERLVDFHDGSILRAYDLNLSQVQTLHVAEEARDLAGDSIGVNDDGNLDARNRRIVNLANAIDDNDAVNYAMLKLFDDSTYNNAQLAATSASAALVSENKAKASEVRSKEAEAISIASANTAVQAATDAHNSKLAVEEAEAIVVPLVPVVEQASQDAAEAADKAEQAVQDVKDLGAVPVGTIMMFTHKAVPAGYLDLCVANPTFDVLEYPDLAVLYPDGILPSFLNRYPKGADITTVGSTGSWTIPEHTHETESHSHERGTMNITGNFGYLSSAGTHNPAYNDPNYLGGAFYTTGSRDNCNYGSVTAGTNFTSNSITVFDASRSWSGSTSEKAPLTKGIRESLNKGSIVDVDHVFVTYAIKAAGLLSTEGIAEFTVIKADVEQLKLDVDQVEQDVITLSGRIDVLEYSEVARGKTVLYDGVVQTTTVPLLDSILNYDMIHIHSHWSSGTSPDARHTVTGTYEPSVLLDASYTEWVNVCRVTAQGTSSSTAVVSIKPKTSIETNLSVYCGSDGNWTGEGISKVVGIKY